ncbi:hypothetical protein CH63R_14341 [Colletotrichum higginsianum IMI 349063]|uniref:DUF3108 domain-containing protein n=2 Tax=Colletotrichum higginsianum TaxID=80884 RepID=A0A1B7XTM2_COLHI|nr:hypothetical protein CH63R_14341 [Colletotrichum higginsianum IMI 349063]OBR03115.1 hypothetical protein CH63R_14341 [Colletotrichum higginsianum IMI 349063]TIC91291.1 hypothetical protein CH35J_011079 [Colletotrichum higginsianum]
MSLVFFNLLLILSLATFGVGGKEPKPQRIKGSEYFLSITGGLIQPTYNIYTNGYQEGYVAITEFKFRRTITGKPILDIAAWNDEDKRVAGRQSLSSLVKAVTVENTKVKLDEVPYVIFRKYEMIEMADLYSRNELGGKLKSFTVTPKDDYWWMRYGKTWSFKATSETFRPRGIREVQVRLRKGRYETWFMLNKA